ncbi:MAG: glycosyltransferase [Lachnospiraceae bacterium]|nr:glycosyltransferase [Lachnospiraceae bacterium]
MKPESLRNDLSRTFRYLKRNGLSETVFSVAERVTLKARDHYDYIPPLQLEIREQRERSRNLEEDEIVKISIVVPAYNTDRHCLVQLIKSVAAQTYCWYELIVADAGDDDVVSLICDRALNRKVMKRPEGDGFTPGSLKYVKLEKNEGISGNLNRAVTYASGDWFQFLDHDDLLSPDALYAAVSAIRKHKDAFLVYCDEDKTDRSGKVFFDLNDKPGFNPDMLLCNNYICHGLTIRRDKVEGFPFRPEFDGAQDYDLLLRILGQMMDKGLSVSDMRRFAVHDSTVAYHWRVHKGSTAGDSSAKSWAYDAGKRALEDFYKAMGIKADVSHSMHLGFYRSRYEPDIFAARNDVGIVCGRVLDPLGRMCAHMGSLEGEEMFSGMPGCFSGRLNRFDTRQDISYGDVRNMKIAPGLRHLLREADDSDTGARSEKICRLARDKGYTVVYDPDLPAVKGRL